LASNIERRALLKKETADRKYIVDDLFRTAFVFSAWPISEISSAEIRTERCMEWASTMRYLLQENHLTIVTVNSLAMVLAMTGVLPPALSAILHNLTTIGVGLHALEPLRV
jgi:hypothetical protein